uniref:Uncharacterized protein n=1 Tax=Rhizophora mucronata TaxID=61149 RepID=A0A2P2N5S3_RHIMU
MNTVFNMNLVFASIVMRLILYQIL